MKVRICLSHPTPFLARPRRVHILVTGTCGRGREMGIRVWEGVIEGSGLRWFESSVWFLSSVWSLWTRSTFRLTER